ncbi:transglutaminase domain-containing protein [Microbacterium radiodurans]|uniref:Transglutaminase domain-containing protein n=1 Tax=Microbacterium radiodurans TaxID=661398 RepID=A0A5J5IW98_9MICO|nr:transglutaminase domain-containing protein [Microbacterium radiodurans]
MRAQRDTQRGSRRASNARIRFLVVQALLLDLVVLVGAAAAFPIYAGNRFVLLVAVALAAAHAIALAGLRWRWSGWWVALVVFGAYLLLGLPLAAPTTLGSLPEAARGLLAVATAPVTGWKDLLTLQLPLGSYQATLAPALLVFLAVPTAAISLAWRTTRGWPAAVVLALLPTVFGVAFGATALAAPIVVGPLSVPREAVVGAAAIVAALGAVVWRTTHDRRRAVAAAVAASGVRSSARPLRTLGTRAAIAGGMVVAAVGLAGFAAPAVLAGGEREVLRAGVDPRLEIADEVSPLAQYRASFADDRFDDVLFRIDAPAGADRVRLATLPFYDGRFARVVDPGAGTADPRTAFARVPATLPAPGGTATGAVRVTIDDYDAAWVPTVGAVTSLAFGGSDAAALADGFFYNSETSGAVQLGEPGLGAGVAYEQGAAILETTDALASLVPARGAASLGEEIVPASVSEWIEAQAVPGGGAGLETLIDRLRARGFLSHALSLTADAVPAWAAELGDYTFQPSRAGHSSDRIDALFTDLITRENEVGGDDDAALVAAVGDDEQFAVAALMIADQLGFDARVVVGMRLASSDDDLAACADGVCTAGDLSAWIEVRGTGSAWVPVDVTPQHTLFPSPDVEQRQDPQIPTDVRQEQAESVLPADANPADGGAQPDDDTAQTADFGALWATLRIGGASLLVLLVLVGPFALVLAAKALRRRDRRRADDVAERFTGGWQEYVDAALDHGRPVPRSQTRSELAAQYSADLDGSDSLRLATWADRSVFDVVPPSETESDEFWRIVEAERARFDDGLGWWARMRARVSLRSVLRRGRGSGSRRAVKRASRGAEGR